jgi:hypothetical protein
MKLQGESSQCRFSSQGIFPGGFSKSTAISPSSSAECEQKDEQLLALGALPSFLAFESLFVEW